MTFEEEKEFGSVGKEAKRAGRRQWSCHTQQLKLPMKKDERDWLARRVWGEGESEVVTKRAGRGIKSVGRSDV